VNIDMYLIKQIIKLQFLITYLIFLQIWQRFYRRSYWILSSKKH